MFLTSHSKEAIDRILKCAPEIREDMAVYTLYKEETETSVRRLTAEKAIEVQEWCQEYAAQSKSCSFCIRSFCRKTRRCRTSYPLSSQDHMSAEFAAHVLQSNMTTIPFIAPQKRDKTEWRQKVYITYFLPPVFRFFRYKTYQLLLSS